MTDPQYPPPNQPPLQPTPQQIPQQMPPQYIVPPKPAASGQSNIPAAFYRPQDQASTGQTWQEELPFGVMSNQVYPTPPPEQYVYPAQGYTQQNYPPQYQQPYQQVPPPGANGQAGYQQPYEQPYQQPYPPQYQQQNQQPYQQPYPQQFQQPGQQQFQQPYPQQFQQQYQQPLTSGFGLHLTLGILSLLLCGGLLAIPAIVFASLMNTAYKQGNIALFMQRRKACRIWLVVAFCIGLVANAIYITMLMDGQITPF